MICMTRGFGAPVTDAGGNVARTSVPTPVPARRRPRTVLTRWCRPGWASSSHSAGTATEPVAGEVDDHHVLGAVLGARRQRRRVGGRPLDRAGLDIPSAPREEALR